ncbi:MAG: hypothetical protein LBM95_10010 [Lactobacillales bacterium]|jgi:hypothetical protein|nr:hypothetical protein [Lactobacillales bacterium]
MRNNMKMKQFLKKYQTRILIGSIILLLLVLPLITYSLLSKKEPSEEAVKEDKRAISYKSAIKKPIISEKDTITFPGYGNMSILEGTEKLAIALVNPSFNHGNIQFIVYLDDEKSPLLKTDIVIPGKAVTEVPLPKGLSVGKHKIKLEMLGFSDNQTRLSGTTTSFELTVLKGE